MKLHKKFEQITAAFLICFFFIGSANADILVYAGAGLKEPVVEIAKGFESKHKTKLILDLQGAGRLANKALNGMVPDVFIVGSNWAEIFTSKKMLKQKKRVSALVPVLVTSVNNPSLKSFSDFAAANKKFAAGNPKACIAGRLLPEILAVNGLCEENLNIVARGATVVQILNWIKDHHADYGIVWQALVKEQYELEIIPIKINETTVETIWAILFKSSPHPENAKKFYDYLIKNGETSFKKFGYGKTNTF